MRLVNFYDHTKKVGTFNGRPWTECLDELDEWDIQTFEHYDKQNAKPRLQRYLENKWFSVRMKWFSLRGVIRLFRNGHYYSATERLIFLLPSRWYSEDQDEYGECVRWGPLTVTGSFVLDHSDIELSFTFRKREYSYRWVSGTEPYRSSGWNVYDRR